VGVYMRIPLYGFKDSGSEYIYTKQLCNNEFITALYYILGSTDLTRALRGNRVDVVLIYRPNILKPYPNCPYGVLFSKVV